MSERDPQATRHRALADAQRVRIIDELRRETGGLDARELARRLALHANTIRWHLAILADAGLVLGKPAQSARRGRPRVVYTLAGPAESTGSEGYRFLATVLTGALAGLDDGHARADRTGAEWGRYLVRRPPPHTRTSDDQALDQVVALLAQQGFRPEADRGEIRMRACPFRDLAEAHPGIVCAVHCGLIRGALGELGATVTVDRLDPFVEPDLCVARLRPAEAP